MKDVKKAAESRAAHPSSTPAGSSFESDRKRAKTALTMQIDSLDSSQIHKIAAVSDSSEGPRKIRVAPYCRVSTDDIDQAISIRLQQLEYRDKIKANPNWVSAGMYVDNGFSGTNTAHRPGFLKLIEDCRAGKIDMVIPKTSVFELTKPYRAKDNQRLLNLWSKVREMSDDVKEWVEKQRRSLKVDQTLFVKSDEDEVTLCLNYDGLYGINNINRFLQGSNSNPAFSWGIQQYKVDDPVLFLESTRFHPLIYNNMKGRIVKIEVLDVGDSG